MNKVIYEVVRLLIVDSWTSTAKYDEESGKKALINLGIYISEGFEIYHSSVYQDSNGNFITAYILRRKRE